MASRNGRYFFATALGLRLKMVASFTTRRALSRTSRLSGPATPAAEQLAFGVLAARRRRPYGRSTTGDPGADVTGFAGTRASRLGQAHHDDGPWPQGRRRVRDAHAERERLLGRRQDRAARHHLRRAAPAEGRGPGARRRPVAWRRRRGARGGHLGS